MKKTFQKSLAVLAAASVCSSMLLNFPSGTFSIHWNWQASAEESVEGIAIDATNFPDEIFRTYVQENFDTTADGILSESELRQATEINVSYKGISDLTGVEYFTALQALNCGANSLTTLDVRQNTALQTLWCSGNNLTVLDVRQNPKLNTLYCFNNNLTALDLSQNTALTNLECDSNTYSIALTGGTFDLSTLPEGFDLSKASNWKNATVDGNTLTVTNPKADVTYTYDLGNEKTETFTLRPTSCTLTESMVKEIPEQVYTGSAVTPDVVFQYGEDTFKKDVDYTVSYTNNQHTGTGNAIITGKGIFSGTVTVPFGIGVAINETTIPDETFRTYVKENIDTTPDGILTVSELEQVTTIDVAFKEIADLTGVEYFTALKELYCGRNNLTELDVRQNTELQKLYCYNNQLKELDVRQNPALQILGCNDNQLKELDVHQNSALQILECSGNQLTELDVRQNPALQELHCYNNNLTELNVCQNTELQTLWCSNNNLTVLDVRQNPALQVLYCYNNNLTELDVRQNTALHLLYCYNNNLTALDLSQNPELTSLAYSNNTYSIALTGGTFDLSTLPGNFDVSKASNWTNATVDGNTLTVTDLRANVTYTYDCGNEKTATFTLQPTSCILTESMVKKIPEQVYTGSAVTPDVVLQYGEDTLKKDVDYTVSYTNNQHTGTGNAIITGKGIFSGTVTVPFGIGVAINETTFPDENFRTYVKENFDTTADDILTVSELEQVIEIDVLSKKISDLTGVEYFTALQRLFCSNNNLTKLDLSQNTALQRLFCESNNLTELDLSQNTALQVLSCSNNNLTELDLSQNTALQWLNCYNNNLTELDLSQNTALQTLSCDNNNLTELDLRQNTALQILNCYSNNLTELDLRQNTKLQVLFCESNNLTKLDVSQNIELQKISCFNNNLTELDVSQNSELQTLYCDNNNLTKLDLSQNTALQWLNCYNNNLTELDLSQDTALQTLSCGNNNLTELDLRQNTALQTLSCDNNNLTELDLSQNTALQELECKNNNLTALDLSQNTALQALYCDENNLTELDLSQNTALRALYCDENNLTALDLSQNSELIDLDCSNNTYFIALTGGTFDLSTLPGNFDVSKASNWTNATVDGNTLTVTDLKADVTYTYDLGNGKTATFTLVPESCTLTESMVEAIPDQIYTGSELKPEVTWKHGMEGTDYTVSYEKNINAGTATVTITGQEFLEGSITISFTILPADLTDAEIKLKEEKLVYNGTEQSPSIESITVGDRVLTEDDYTIIGNTATESGTYTMTVQGKGNFTGKATAEWSIAKATPSVTPVLPDQEYIVGDSLPELGYKCSVDGVITWITNLEKGLIEGENELEWRFTPDDADNYETVTGTALIVAETTTTTTTTTSTSTTTSTTTTTAKPVTSTTTKTNATTTSTNPTTTSTTKAIATTTATKPVTTSTTKAVVTTTATKPVTTTTTKAVVTTTATKPITTSTTKAIATTTTTKPVTTSTTKAATTTTATKPVTTSTTKAIVTTTTTKPVTTSTTKAIATTTTTKPVTTSTTKAIVTTTATKPVTTSTTKAIVTTTATKPVTTSTTKAATTTTATKPVTTSTTKAMITTTATKPITTSTTKVIVTTTATKPITTSTTKAIVTTTATKPVTTTTKPVTTIQTTTSTNETTTKATLTTTTAQTTTCTNATTTTTQATTTSTTTNATTTTMQSTITSSTVTTTTTTLLTTTSSVVSTTTTPVVTTVPTTTTGEASIVVVPKEADFYFAEDTTVFTPSDLFESITLIQEDGTEVDITDQITLPEVSPSTVETDEQHRAILPVFYQDELLAELTVPVYIGKKGDIDLDGDVTLADATLALTYYSEHAVNNDFYFTTQSAQAPQTEAEQMLEKLMFFLADIDTESKQGADTDNGIIELLDATRILTYYAEQAVGNLPSWSN